MEPLVKSNNSRNEFTHGDDHPHGSAIHQSGQRIGASNQEAYGSATQLTTEGLARLMVRVRKTTAYEDRFDGDPVNYPLFIRQFRDNVLDHYEKYDPAHALVRLTSETKGQARKIVEACQVDENPARALKAALDDLKEAFGAPQLQVDAQLKMIKEGPMIKPTADGLQDLYIGCSCHYGRYFSTPSFDASETICALCRRQWIPDKTHTLQRNDEFHQDLQR